MKNFMTIDTEGTYNIGYTIFNEQGIVMARELVIKENFNDNREVSENNRQRKIKIFNEDKTTYYGNVVAVLSELQRDIKKYAITKAFAHNKSEDEKQITRLVKQAEHGVVLSFNPLDDICLYDSITIFKLLYPKNTDYSLEGLVNDITGAYFQQLHTGKNDSIWLAGLLYPLFSILDILVEYGEIFQLLQRNDWYRTVIALFLKSQSFIKDTEIFEALGKVDFTIKTLNTQLKELLEKKLLSFRALDKYGVKGNLLKTKANGYCATALGHSVFTQLLTIYKTDYTESIATALLLILKNCLPKDTDAALKKYQEELDRQYNKNVDSLKRQLSKSQKAFEAQKLAEYQALGVSLEQQYQTLAQKLYNPALQLFTVMSDKTKKKEVKTILKRIKKGEDPRVLVQLLLSLKED